MNDILKKHAKAIIHSDPTYFRYLETDNQLIIKLCENLSSFGFFDNLSDQDIGHELYDIFIYLFYNNKKKFEEAIQIRDNYEINVNKETLIIINKLINEDKSENLYKDIIKVCNTITYKIHDISYEEFLIKYIEETLYSK